MIGIGAATGRQRRIAKTIAAAAGGHCLTLRHSVKAAAQHIRRDVPAAILIRRRRRCHRNKCQCEKRSGRRNACFRKLSHLLLSLCVLVFSPGTDMGCRLRPRHQHRKKAKEFSVELNKRSKWACCEVLKYNHHLITKHDRHARIMRRSAVQKSLRGLTLKQGGYARPDGKLSVIRG